MPVLVPPRCGRVQFAMLTRPLFVKVTLTLVLAACTTAGAAWWWNSRGGDTSDPIVVAAAVQVPSVMALGEDLPSWEIVTVAAPTGQDVGRIALAAAERGMTVLMVTHDNRILGFADRILEMEDGRITGERVENSRTASTVQQFDRSFQNSRQLVS